MVRGRYYDSSFSTLDNWVRTRRIWNQHSYHITNITSVGSIPASEEVNWLKSGHNNYRVNIPTSQELGVTQDGFDYKNNDGEFDSNIARVTIEVLNNVSPPEILSQPVVFATVGFPYAYPVLAFDPDVGDVLTYALSSAPAGMSIDGATGLISWTPANGDTGNHSVGVTVTDSQGQADFQSYTLSVALPILVPDVIGDTQDGAEDEVTAVTLVLGRVSDASTFLPALAIVSRLAFFALDLVFLAIITP